MTSMYHSHPHHLSFTPNTTNPALLGSSMPANHHSNLFNQATSSSNNSSGCQANSSSSSSMSSLSHSQNAHPHQQMAGASACNNLAGLPGNDGSGSSSNHVTSNGVVAAAIAGYYNLQNNLSHQPHHFTTTSALQPHYPSLFNPMLSNSIGSSVGNSIGNSIGNPGQASNSSFVQYQNQMTNNTTGYLSNNHHLNSLQNLNSQQTPSNGSFHANRYGSASNLTPISASSMLNGRLMFNDLNGANSVGGSNSTCSNSTINSLEEPIIKKPIGKLLVWL